MTLSHEDTSSLKYLHNYLNYSNLHHIFTTMKYDPLRFYSKSELAQLAGVSYSTFYRFLKTRQSVLETIGITLYAKKLPPHIVKYLCEEYCIDLPPTD